MGAAGQLDTDRNNTKGLREIRKAAENELVQTQLGKMANPSIWGKTLRRADAQWEEERGEAGCGGTTRAA